MTNTNVNNDRAQTAKALENELGRIARTGTRSAWGHGVGQYAQELLDDLVEFRSDEEIRELIKSPERLKRALLNGARDWDQYSEGGCSLVYDGDILERLAPATWKRSKAGRLFRASGESWITVQAQALREASVRVYRVARIVRSEQSSN